MNDVEFGMDPSQTISCKLNSGMNNWLQGLQMQTEHILFNLLWGNFFQKYTSEAEVKLLNNLNNLN